MRPLSAWKTIHLMQERAPRLSAFPEGWAHGAVLLARGGVEALAKDVDHVRKVRVVPHDWQPDVARPLEHPGREWEGVFG